jgi:DNA-binding transcriptional ArsR family regulator
MRAVTEETSPDRDPEAVRRFIERFATAMVEAGMPRMPARMFVALLTADAGGRTAAELAGLLQVSPAAISGAARYLTALGMLTRESEAGSRRHYYRVPDNVWYELVRMRDPLLRWMAILREGAAILGPHSPAGARMTDSADYFAFVAGEMPGLLARWQEHKAALAAARSGQPGSADGSGPPGQAPRPA